MQEYIRDVYVASFDAQFRADQAYSADGLYDDTFHLDIAHERIDIEPMLYQAVMLTDPIVHVKPGVHVQEDDEENTL